MKQKIDAARIADFGCEVCLDTGVQIGTATIADEKVRVLRPCTECNEAENRRKWAMNA